MCVEINKTHAVSSPLVLKNTLLREASDKNHSGLQNAHMQITTLFNNGAVSENKQLIKC